MKDWYSKEFVPVLQQVVKIAMPHPKFNNFAPCPYLARAMATNKVSMQQGTQSDIIIDVNRGREQIVNNKQWAAMFWYQPNQPAKELEIICDVYTDNDITCFYMHREHSTKPLGLELTGEYPLLIVQSTPLLETARQNLSPEYPLR